MMLVFGIFFMTRPKPFSGGLLPFRILYISLNRYDVTNILRLVNTWEFNPAFSCAFIIWVVLVWMVLSSCSLSSQL